MDVRVRFAKRLKSLREAEGYSIGEFAKAAKISRQHIRELELPYPRKRVTIVTLAKIAAALHISLSKMLESV